MICSDETRFDLDGSDGFSYYSHDLCKEEEDFSTRPMICASFSWTGKSSIYFVDGRMNSNGYGEVLENHLVNIGGLD